MADTSTLDILHSEGSDSIVLCDPVTHDDIAEVFHCERHTVTQTPDQAMDIALRFAASASLLSSLRELLVIAGTPITERQEQVFARARAAIALAEGCPA